MNALKTLVFSLAAAACIAPLAASACDANFTLVNHSGASIYRVFVSPSDRNRWYRDNDFLTDDTVPPGGAYTIDVNSAWTYNGNFDVRVEWSNGAHRELYQVPLCRRDTVVVGSSGTLY